MQDLFAEVGLSSGAVYLQFKSKDELILAIAEDNMASVLAALHASAQLSAGSSSLPTPTLGDALVHVVDTLVADGLAALAVQVWSEATINPAIADAMGMLISRLRMETATLIATEEIDQDMVNATARIAVATVAGLLVQRALLSPSAVEADLAALRAMFPQGITTGNA